MGLEVGKYQKQAKKLLCFCKSTKQDNHLLNDAFISMWHADRCMHLAVSVAIDDEKAMA